MRHPHAILDEAGATPPSDGLSQAEILRYSRHLIMPEVGLAGQMKLKGARVLLVGAGGLGSPVALYLSAAGIGTLGIVDDDEVDLTNLQRQVIHGTDDIGRSKLESAIDSVRAINPNVNVIGHETILTSANAMDIVAGYDIVVDGTDNFPTRYLVNDVCVFLKRPNVYGSIFRFDGQASVFAHRDGPCYRCLFPEPPPPGTVPSCAEGGVLGILPGVIGLIQATEVCKLVLGCGEPLVGRLVLYEALAMRFTELSLARDPNCPVCGDNPTIREPIDYYEFCGVAGHGQSARLFDAEIGPEELNARLDHVVLVDVREPHEYEINRIPNSVLIPLGDLPARVSELDSADEIVVHCLSGVRSAQACQFLRQAGFKKVSNLRGGIRAWHDRVDPSLPQY